MINRAKMPRQLRGKGGITNVVPRTNYLFGGIKKRIRKLIPNELADVAVKAAPFVAMIPGYGPAAAGIMRGVGRFDQRGSLSDAFKQGLLTYGGGKLFGAGLERAGLRDSGASGIGDFFNQGTRDKASSFFKGGEESTKLIDTPPGGGDPSMTFTKPTKGFKSVIEGAKKLDNIPIIGELPNMVKQQILIGGVSGAATYIYEAFLKEEPPQQEGETYEEYIARRKENVGRKMKGYFDNYFKFDKDYSSMTDEQKQAFIDRVNVKDGGRIKYQTGGITMANTLAENIRRNLANQAAVAQQFQTARSKLPGYTAPVVQRSSDEVRQPYVAPPVTPAGSMTPIAELDKIREQVLREQENDPFEMRLREEEKLRDQTMPVPKPSNFIDDTFRKLPVEPDPDTPIDELVAPIMPTLPVEPMTDQQILEGFAKFKEQNPEAGMGAGLAVMIYGRLPDGTPLTFTNSAQASAFNQYLESIGQPPFERVSGDIKKITDNEEKSLSKLAGGGMPTGIMKTNKAGVMERDYRDKGGFVPVGIKEKADDVPAMLSKNEFVMTADAVRGAGNGSIEKGAQRMYDTMKNLEKRVV